MNNEAILNKLIELGQLDFTTKQMMESLRVTHSSVYELMLADAIQRALFDECGKRDLEIIIKEGFMIIDHLFEDIDYIYEGDTSRESFKAAFEKVVGI